MCKTVLDTFLYFLKLLLSCNLILSFLLLFLSLFPPFSVIPLPPVPGIFCFSSFLGPIFITTLKPCQFSFPTVAHIHTLSSSSTVIYLLSWDLITACLSDCPVSCFLLLSLVPGVSSARHRMVSDWHLDGESRNAKSYLPSNEFAEMRSWRWVSHTVASGRQGSAVIVADLKAQWRTF